MANDKLFKKAVVDKIEKLAKQLAEAKLLVNHNPKWSTPEKYTECIVKDGGIGVYKITHKEFGVAYIGHGNVSSRKSRHLSVFKNNGKDLVSDNGNISPSQAGKKMYEFDKNIENWFFSYCVLHDKAVSKEYEKVLIEAEEPLFNSEYMAGVN